MLKRIPRQLFIFNVYGYVFVAAFIVIAAMFMLGSDRLGIIDFVILGAMIGAFVLFWWRFHPRLPKPTLDGTPLTADRLLEEIRRNHRFTLLAFESEYCPFCMASDGRVVRLEELDTLHVQRLSINSEPGCTLFHHFDGRGTPTFLLFDKDGKLIQDWPYVLPVERVLYAIKDGARA